MRFLSSEKSCLCCLMGVLYVTFTYRYYPLLWFACMPKVRFQPRHCKGLCSWSACLRGKMHEGTHECVDPACGALAASMSGASFRAFFLSSFLTLGVCSELWRAYCFWPCLTMRLRSSSICAPLGGWCLLAMFFSLFFFFRSLSLSLLRT